MTALRKIAGPRPFLLVGDSKLISYTNAAAMNAEGVGFVAPLAASRVPAGLFAALPAGAGTAVDYAPARDASKPAAARGSYRVLETASLPPLPGRSAPPLPGQRVPDPSIWPPFAAFLADLPRLLSIAGAQRLHVRGAPHLTVAFALGAAYPPPAPGRSPSRTRQVPPGASPHARPTISASRSARNPRQVNPARPLVRRLPFLLISFPPRSRETPSGDTWPVVRDGMRAPSGCAWPARISSARKTPAPWWPASARRYGPGTTAAPVPATSRP